MEEMGAQLLWDLDLAALGLLLAQCGQEEFRARQLFRWLHLRGICDPQQMTDLPQKFRTWLLQQYPPQELTLAAKQQSADGSVKYGWLTARGNPVEAVLMPPTPHPRRPAGNPRGAPGQVAICVSCQSGCAFRCGFCATGRMGLRESFSTGQILAQLYQAERDSGLSVERLLFMGMGEPLRNFASVKHAIEILTDEVGRAWSPRRITLSTVGLTQLIIRAADELPRINLALSLHFTTDRDRSVHMPQGEASLTRLAGALYYYRRVNGGKITIEYALMHGLNDSETDARRLARFARLTQAAGSETALEAEETPVNSRLQPLPLHVNLIAYNWLGSYHDTTAKYRPSSDERVSQFAGLLVDEGVPVTVRRSRGADIAAACGMLGATLAPDAG